MLEQVKYTDYIPFSSQTSGIPENNINLCGLTDEKYTSYYHKADASKNFLLYGVDAVLVNVIAHNHTLTFISNYPLFSFCSISSLHSHFLDLSVPHPLSGMCTKTCYTYNLLLILALTMLPIYPTV